MPTVIVPLDASEYYQRLTSSVSAAGTAMQQSGASASNLAGLQRKLKAESDALAGTQGKAAVAAKSTSESIKSQGDALQKLLGQIDPTVAALNRLDDQEQELRRHQKSGLVDTDTFNDYKAKIDASRASLSRFGDDADAATKGTKKFSVGTKESRENVLQLANALSEGNFRIAAHNIAELGVSAGTSASGLLAVLGPALAVGAAVVALGLAYSKGADENTAYNKALILTGNYAGVTAGQLGAMAKELDSLDGVTQSSAADALTKVAESGKFAGEQIKLVATAAEQMRVSTGQSVEETVAEFAKLKKDPVDAILDLNDKYHFLTDAQYEQIESLKEQGRQQEAATLAMSTYASVIADRTPQINQNLGTIERAWKAIKNAASETVDGALNIGRVDDDTTRIDSLTKKIAYLKSTIGTGFEPLADTDGEVKNLSAELDGLLSKQKKAAQAPTATVDRASIDARKKAQDDFDRIAISNLDKKAKLEREIANIQKVGLAAGKSQAEIDTQVAAARKQYEDSLAKPSKAAAFQDDAATKLLQSLREQQSSLESQLSTTETLTASQKARVQFEQQIADLKTKDILTADQKSLVANQDAIKAQLDKNVAIAEEVRLHQDSIKLQERAAQIQETIKSSTENVAEQRQRQLDSFGKGSKASDRANSSASIYKEYQRYQDQLNKATPKSQLGSAAYTVDVDQIKDGLNKALAANEDYYSKLDELQGNWKNGATAAFADFSDKAKDIAGQTYDVVSSTLETVSKGIGDSVADAIVQGKTLQESFSALSQTILTEVISSLVQLGVRYGINAALEIGADSTVTAVKATNAAVVSAAQITAMAATSTAAIASSTAVAAAQLPAAAATTAAWAPAATVASIGSFGGAAAIGLAAVIAALAFSKGFKTGGYTGNGGTSDVAGVVHGKEYVFDAASTARIGKDNLDAMRRGQISGVAPAANYAAAAANMAQSSGAGSSTAASPPVNQHFYNTFPAVTDSREAKKSTAQAARQAGRAIQNLKRYS